MSFDLVRQNITTALELARVAWTDYALRIEYDNLPDTDLAELTDPYLLVDILWGRARQMDLGKAPIVSDYGTIVLAAGVKDGNGTAKLLKLLQHFREYLQLRDDIGIVRTKVASLEARPVLKGGMYYQTLSVPFWTTSVATPMSGGIPVPTPDSTPPYLSLIATDTVGAGRAVAVNPDGSITVADNAELTHSGRVLGINKTAVVMGDQMRVYQDGLLEDGSWNWTPGEELYFDTAGVLTHNVPNSGAGAVFVQSVALAIAPTKIVVQLDLPIEF